MTSPPTIHHAEMFRLLAADSYIPSLYNSINPQLCRDSYPDPAITFISSNKEYWQHRLMHMPPLIFWKYAHLVYQGKPIDRTCLDLLKKPIDPSVHFICKSTIPDPRLFTNVKHAFGLLDGILTDELAILMEDHCNNKQSPFHTLVKLTRPMVYAIKIPRSPSEIIDIVNEEDKYYNIGKWNHLDSHKNIELNSNCIIVLCQEINTSLQVEIPNTRKKPRISSIRTKLEPSAAYYSSVK